MHFTRYFLALIVMLLPLESRSADDVSLVVSGQAADHKTALTMALRSARAMGGGCVLGC